MRGLHRLAGYGLICLFAITTSRPGHAAPAMDDPEPAGLSLPQLTAIGSDGMWLSNPLWSPDGRLLSFSTHESRGVYLLDTADGSCVRITDAAGSGYAYNFSSDGRWLGFKLLLASPGKEFPAQMPVVYDALERKVVALHTAVARCGVPSFAADGTVAFTIDEQLQLTDTAGRPIKQFDLGNYANLTPISPDGAYVAFNDREDQIWVLETASGRRTSLTKGESCFNPIWSPDSTKIAVNTITGKLKTIELGTGCRADLGLGSSASWSSDSHRVLFCRSEKIPGVKLISAEIYNAAWDGSDLRTALPPGAVSLITSARLSPDGQSLACGGPTTEGLIRVNLAAAKSVAAAGSYAVKSTQSLVNATTPIRPLAEGDPALTSVLTQVLDPIVTAPMAQVRINGTAPYVHQCYDTPNWFDGGAACGATAAIMGIQYFDVLDDWDCTCSSPYSHVSHYGRYICETYTYGSYTYNISSADDSGTPATGGYGYIVRNNWRDTKGYMRDYIRNHGLGSEADFSTNWTKLQTEINNSNPFVLLCDITTSGHYILTIGYFDSQHTMIFNDPYGNKNTGYMNYSGIGVYYDWPGYNNGYQNVNFAECFIYCRGGPTITQHPVTSVICPGASTSFSVAASGSNLSYHWQKNGVNIYNGGHYSGVNTTILTISPADAGDAGGYSCMVSGNGGSRSSNVAALTLRAATQIHQQPTPVSVCPGGSAQFSIFASCYGAPTYRWQKNGTDLFDGGHYAGTGSGVLTVSNAAAADAASYRCVVTGGCGVAISDPASLLLNAPVTFSEQPQSQPFAAFGANVSFSVVANGTGPLTYQWQKNESNLTNSEHILGATTATLTITGVDPGDSGSYRCLVTGSCGASFSDTATLGVGLPVIFGDFDGDADLDMDDYARAQQCFSGNQPHAGPPCDKADFDHNGTVDRMDVMMIQACFSGAGIIGDPNCPPF